ncbi:TGF-beta-activated kinase 1 and MAP3K7-binding protein 2-like isoform X2 [Ischnura elegans]|uniref:TGF-beta-activated kinase 1 and MAP3K7-binding protein 2-like isoform X2 n=1 Tax=Ischnura elegans TaxID=197161 RepID=UPI001ED89579|nr:TGF-beta-activated kinase 1 and MAP3K7-binding protein 2-like isoform X2 [Ischnura elegans]
MADRSNFFIMHLFHEMKQRFPAIPDRVVSECIRQNFNDKKICEAILTVKNRNFSRRQFPSAQAANMLPAAVNDESTAVGANDTSTTESETESSRCEDDACATSETEETEFSDSREPPDPSVIGVNAAMPPASSRAVPGTVASDIPDVTDNLCRDPIKISDVRDVPTSFGPPLSLEGCGRGFGGGCCCRHGEELELLRQYGDSSDIVSMVEGVMPLRGGDSDFLSRNDVAFDVLGGGDVAKFGQGAPRKLSAANIPPHTSASLPGVRLPGVVPPPSSQVPNIEDLTSHASLINLSSPPPSVPFVDPGFNYPSHIPENRPPKGAGGSSYVPSADHLPHGVPLSPPFKPRLHDQNIGQYEDSFLEEPSMTSHDVEDFSFNVNCRLKTSGVGSHFLDEEDERRMELGSKGKTSASSTVKLTTTSPTAPPLSRKHVSPQGLQPTPVFAGHRQFRSTKESPTSPGRPVSPSNYANATASPSASQLIETPVSYTSVNLTVRQPSSDPLPPIDIRSSVGDSSVYTSSCFPQQSFQSELQIRIGGSAGISGGSGYAPMSPSWKSQQTSPKSQTACQSPPVSQRRPHDHSPSRLAPESRGAGFRQNSPQTSRRENVERPRSLYGPSSLKTQAQVSGSLPDVSKARSFTGDHEKVAGPGARNTAVHYQPDVRSRPPASVPSSPATGLPPPGPLPTSNSPKERPRHPANASSSFEGHSQATCSDVSRCKALLVHQMERKNLLERELNCEREKLKSMQEQTKSMERDLRIKQMQQRCHASLPIIQKVHALRQEIKYLQEECKKRAQAVDLNSDIQVPLGETDEEFYKNIYTGQRGWVLVPRPDSQSHEPQLTATFHQESREQWRRHRENPAPPGMEHPGGVEGVHVRADPVGGTRMGPSTSSEGPNWMCSSCTFHNHPALDKCEQCEMPRIMLEGSQTQDIHIHVTHHNFPIRSDLRYSSLPADYS